MNNLCVLPFNSLSIDARGNIRVCCSSEGKNFTKRIQNLSVDDIINTPEIINIRNDFLNDIKNSACDRCWNIEKIGNQSFRNAANEKPYYGIKDNNIIKFQSTVDYDSIQFLDITVGNKCNLACRMCHPASSSLLSPQWEIINHQTRYDKLIEFDQQTKEKILEVIRRSKNLTTIYLLGGEPLVSDFHDEILDMLISLNRAKDIVIQYSTNLNVNIEKHMDRWSHFRYIDLGISIDGTGKTYEYIRWPGKWDKLERNIKSVYDYSKETKNIHPFISTTVQNLNADNLYDLIRAVLDISDFNFYFVPITGHNKLHYLPTDILIDSRNQLSTIKATEVYRINDLLSMYDDAITKSKSLDSGFECYDVTEFFRFQQGYDKIRGQNLFKFRPYFSKVAQVYNINTW